MWYSARCANRIVSGLNCCVLSIALLPVFGVPSRRAPVPSWCPLLTFAPTVPVRASHVLALSPVERVQVMVRLPLYLHLYLRSVLPLEAHAFVQQLRGLRWF